MAKQTAKQAVIEPAGADPSGDDAPEDALGYEEARDQLIDVVRKLEAGGVTLEESLALWERGERLAATCQRWLDGARARLESVTTPATPDDPDAPATDSNEGVLHSK